MTSKGSLPVFLQFSLKPLEPEFFAGGIRWLEEPVRVEREHVSLLCVNLGTCENHQMEEFPTACSGIPIVVIALVLAESAE